MGNEKVIIRPSDIGLKDLEIFYNPELLFDFGDGEQKRQLFKKTLITGAVIVALNTPIISVQANEVLNIKTVPVECLVDAVSSAERIKEETLNEIFSIITKEKTTFFTSDEIDEMRILDAYHSQVKKYYPAKNKIRF